MRRAFTVLLAIVLVALVAPAPAMAQAQPYDNFAAAGLGFQQVATPQLSGWAEMCHRNPDLNVLGMALPSYLCAATDYTSVATSARVNVNTVLLYNHWLAAGTKTGAGAAMNNNGVGGSFDLGCWGAMRVSELLKIDGLHLVASVTWQKDNVAAAAQAGTVPQVLKHLGAHATFRFGFGKGW
jgi:hypothetical protein